MVDLGLCERYVNYGMYLRIIATFISLYIIFKYFSDHKSVYVILAVSLLILDELDNVWTKFYENNACSKTFYYQYTDKIIDTFSYFLICRAFNLQNTLFASFLVYRAIGVLLFCLTKNSLWLIIMPDFLKEYLVYLYIYNKDTTFLPLWVSCKVAFEYYYHTHHNKRDYN